MLIIKGTLHGTIRNSIFCSATRRIVTRDDQYSATGTANRVLGWHDRHGTRLKKKSWFGVAIF